MVLSDVVIVLSRPTEPGNVGAVCRAMKNMGLTRLRLAQAAALDGERIRVLAVHAADLWEQAEHFDSLKAAVADCSLVIGTTRRTGRRRASRSLTPAETAAYLKTRPSPSEGPTGPAAGSVALIFGNERTGLEDQELALCNLASHIPSSAAFPSLNLSHAVQIYAYELFRALAEPDAAKGHWVPLGQEAIDDLVRQVSGSLERIGFYRQPGREAQERYFRDIFSRAGLTRGEADYLEEIFSKAMWLATKVTATKVAATKVAATKPHEEREK